ncbi:MAG: tail fiber domain-containing protein [Candidatus Liberibacter ctenarytainae]|uniref:Tail fiber domain-containing protein n=1 Tax=Candidatus Liberibacter ctenarytainae TaxID=2020335 RepID=A0A937DJ22_9HYPH|nr:tail fiber domain-containing protein [Candidatus Liberibacter ctenarytainae]
MMGKEQAPSSPDPKQIASTQFAGNVGSSIANLAQNHMDQVTPYGQLQYKQTGTQTIADPFTGRNMVLPHYTQIQSLNPVTRKIYDQHYHRQDLLSDVLTQSFNNLIQQKYPSGEENKSYVMPDMLNNPALVPHKPLPNQYDNISDDDGKNHIKDYENALFSRLNPHLQQDRQSLETKLANQGLLPGSVAWNRSFDESNRNENDARLAVLLKSAEEQERMENIRTKKPFFDHLMQIQGKEQKMKERQQSLQEILSLMQATSLPNLPFQKNNEPPITPINYANMAQDDFDNRLLMWKENNKKTLDALRLGGQVLGAATVSDRRMKRNIKPVAGLYQYRYRSDPENIQRIGVMAQEINKIRPDTVKVDSQGIQSVDYGRLFQTAQILRKKAARKSR